MWAEVLATGTVAVATLWLSNRHARRMAQDQRTADQATREEQRSHDREMMLRSERRAAYESLLSQIMEPTYPKIAATMKSWAATRFPAITRVGLVAPRLTGVAASDLGELMTRMAERCEEQQRELNQAEYETINSLKGHILNLMRADLGYGTRWHEDPVSSLQTIRDSARTLLDRPEAFRARPIGDEPGAKPI